MKELEARGYDITTIEFRVRRKALPAEATVALATYGTAARDADGCPLDKESTP